MWRPLLRGAVWLALGLAPLTASAAVFPCTEAGVLAAIAAGGGPHTFSCAGPTTIVTSAELLISQTVELDGGGLLTLSGGDAHRVISIPSVPIYVTLRNLDVVDGSPGGCMSNRAVLTLDHVHVSGCQGGGIGTTWDLTLVDSSVTESQADYGGGISGVEGSGQAYLTLTRSTIRNNRAAVFGGGILAQMRTTITDSTISDNVAQSGGGLRILNALDVLISRSTISHNIATANSGARGGGIYTVGALVTVVDSTLASNLPEAIVTLGMGNPHIPAPTTLWLDHSTVAGPIGTVPSAIVHPLELSTVLLRNAIISGRCNRSARSEGVNIESPGHTCAVAPADLRDVAPAALNLRKLGPHGGPTWTMPLRSPSVAIDGAPGCLSATDQRGVARPQGSACDVGAYEWDGDAPVPALPPAGVAALLAVLAASAAPALRARRSA